MKLYLLIVVALLSGCYSIPGDPSKMNADQLNAVAKDRSAMAACTIVNSPWGVGRTIYVQLDQKTIASGGVSVGTDCTITIQSDAVQKAAEARASSFESRAAPRMNCYRGSGSDVVVCEPVR